VAIDRRGALHFLVMAAGQRGQGMVQDQSRDAAYSTEAYSFLLEALARTRHDLDREGHVTGTELLAGIRKLATERYGPMAALVFQEWGIRSGDDFGSIVYELVDKGVLSRKAEDRIDDFLGGQPYQRIFEEEYFAPDKNR
jgi:uncharacterized repeat protein (TIGR04138 family)